MFGVSSEPKKYMFDRFASVNSAIGNRVFWVGFDFIEVSTFNAQLPTSQTRGVFPQE
jgi:hypothetical protein